MDRPPRWHDYVTLNLYWWGLSTATGTLTPVLLPFLVAMFVPAATKTTYLAIIRVISLAAAMAVQPMAGLLSDRCTHPWGRRRPYITAGTLLSLPCLAIVGASALLFGSGSAAPTALFPALSPAYLVLLLGIVLWQASANVAQGALQGLIPDRVPEPYRGRASGIKTVMELLAAVPIIFLGRLVDSGRVGLVLGLVALAMAVPWLVTVLAVREQPLAEKPAGRLAGPLLRLIALAAAFVAVTQAASWASQAVGRWAGQGSLSLGGQVLLAGLVGLALMAGAVVGAVRLGVGLALGREALGQQRPFVWWVTNRLLFLAAIGSIQGLTLYYLSDVHRLPNPAAAASLLAGAVAACLVPSALASGYLADRLGRTFLVALAGGAAALGTLILILAPRPAWVTAGACVLGVATGAFMAGSWALGTDLVPKAEAGRYLGIANLAGAGAGIVGVGIGGPLADAVNALQPGLGYLTVFSVFGALFLLSVVALLPLARRPALRRT